MSTTISSHQSHHLPLVATLSVVGVIAAAGIVGVAVHESTSGAADQSPAVTQPRPAEQPNAVVAERGQAQNLQYGQYQHYYSGQKLGSGDFHGTTSGGKTVDAP
jgi:hypothetical protein